MFQLFSVGVVDTGGKFATGIKNTCSIGGKYVDSVIDTGGEFATGKVDTDGALWLANISANLWKKFEMALRDLGEDDSRKKPEARNLVTLSL